MQTQIKVRGYHLDVYQHVNNARYLEFLEEARWDGLESSPAFHWMTSHNIAFVWSISISIIVARRYLGMYLP